MAEKRKRGCDAEWQQAIIGLFKSNDYMLLNPDMEGYGFDPDILLSAGMNQQKFLMDYFDQLKQIPPLIAVGITVLTFSRTCLWNNFEKHAKAYRKHNARPDQIEIDEAAAAKVARDDELARLQLETVTLRGSLQDAEAKLITNQELVDKFEGKYQKYKEQAKEKKVEIKEKNVVISDLKGQVTALQKKGGEPDVTVEVELLALNKIVEKDDPEVALDYLDKRKGTTRQYYLKDKKLGMFDSTAETTIKAIAADQEGNPNGKAQALLSCYGKFQEAVNGTDTDTEVYDLAITENASLKAQVAKLTKQLQVLKNELEYVTKKNEADLQSSLNEKELRVDELTNRLVDAQQENEIRIWEINKLKEEVAVLKTRRETYMMHGIEREAENAQLKADNGHLKNDLTSAESQAAAEKEDRRKSSEGHHEAESQLQEEVTTLKRQLSVEKAKKARHETETTEY